MRGNIMRMPSKKQYNLVTNDEFDTRVPLHPEEAFHHGIKFNTKYIGTLDVPRPSSRIEIVAAMRRIRYEFKAKGIKKKKITLEISVDGVKITLRKKKKQSNGESSQLLVMSHPVYRIFYVSHDSQDLKIFSYIARDPSSNIFRCHVFKANKKSQAMKVVRTVGQAFEVCHKLATKEKSQSPECPTDQISREGSDISEEKPKNEICDSESGHEDLMTLTSDTGQDDDVAFTQRANNKVDLLSPSSGQDVNNKPISESLLPSSDIQQSETPLSIHHQLQLLREQQEQQQQHTQAAVAQVHLLRDQLAAETAARLEAQARTHQLLVHNKELLEHIQQLVMQVRELEMKFANAGSVFQSGIKPIPSLPEVKSQDLSQEQHSHQAALTQQFLQQQLKQHQQVQQVQQAVQQAQQPPTTTSPSIPSLSSEANSNQSSGDSLSAAFAQLYNLDPRRLPQVPEDSIPLTPFTPLSNRPTQGFNGPIGNRLGALGTLPPNMASLGGSMGPITRAASERYSRQETLAQLQRMAWARHTTK